MHNCPVGGHQGIQRTIERIKLYTSWPNLDQDVQYIRECQLNRDMSKCQITIGYQQIRKTPRGRRYLDVVGPLPTTKAGMKNILTCQDNLSNYFIAVPIQNQTAEEVANTFVRKITLT
jgi:hypothetical protein